MAHVQLLTKCDAHLRFKRTDLFFKDQDVIRTNTGTIFIHIQGIIKTNIVIDWTINLTVKRKIIGRNLLTKFHEDQTINVAPRVLTRLYYSHKYSHIKKNAPAFPTTGTIFALVQDIIGTNLLTKFHDDLTLNVESRGKIPRLLGGHFHEDRTINVASRVLSRKNAPPPDIIGMNYLIKFHEDRTKHVASRLLTRKNAPPLGSHVFQPKVIIFERIHYIIETNLLTTFHEHWTINAAHTVFTRNNSQPPGGYDFQATGTIFALVQDIIRTNLLTKFHDNLTLNVASIGKIPRPIDGHFHEDRTINVVSRVKKAPPPGGHLFRAIGIIFELFHEDRTKNVAPRLLTRKNAPPLGSHVFQPNVTIFELIHYIIETNLLTTFHEHWTINVASRV
ncbi:hypothetical protein DPMN_143312 [Dreissena polymorpha]|uniref:Uncharacterized protein n=1 Tax=Dreissena polymorpha TaxID=45954 RepID=A0A9D4GG12_DREPO|nr:hypothetical protein DPMN_143312 [Dreissena polymorpha]